MSAQGPRSRPLIWVNCAVSLDGRLAFASGARAHLSGPEDRLRVQRLRAESDAIVVGAGTVVLDDPSLKVHWEELGRTTGPPRTRIVLDAHGRLPVAAKVLDGSAPTIVATVEENSRHYPPHVDRVVAGRGRVDLPTLWAELHRRGMRRVLVEGGSHVIESVIASRLLDRFTVYVAPVVIGADGAPPLVAGPAVGSIAEAMAFEMLGVERIDTGYVVSYAPLARRA
ncbi:MAG: RibD family protein [Thermoplasmata archaeon]